MKHNSDKKDSFSVTFTKKTRNLAGYR